MNLLEEKALRALVETITAAAVAEERERCALIAEAWAWGRKNLGPNYSYYDGVFKR